MEESIRSPAELQQELGGALRRLRIDRGMTQSEAAAKAGIAVRSLSEIRSSPQLRHAAPVDHDAIDDARLERSATIHYYNAGRWLILHSGDAGDQGVSP